MSGNSHTIQTGWDDLLGKAVEWNDLEGVRDLLKRDSQPVFRQNSLDETPLHAAVKWGYGAVAELLIAHGADVNARTVSGEAPLHYAAEDGNEEIASLLLASGADLQAKNNAGQTALHWAAQNGHTGMATLLLAHGADVNARDHLDQTPTHLCARWEPELSSVLQQYGGRD